LKKYLSNIPLIALVVSNTVPLWGVLFLGWDAFYIVLLYWAENIIIGFYNILKIAFVKAPSLRQHLGKLFDVTFFVFHYSAFIAIHGYFVLGIYKKGGDAFSQRGPNWPCFLVFFQLLAIVIKYLYSTIPANMKYALAALFISHGVSFVHNYLLKGKFAVSTPDQLMAEPYTRLVVMHIALLVGGFFAMKVGEPTVVLLALVALKIVLDGKLQMREHRRKQKSQPAEQT
jgi:hypothetical protein